MDDFDDLIPTLSPWLAKRCAYAASTRPGLSAEELFQAVVLRAYLRAERGWFDQAPQVHIHAQAKTLLNNCIRQELKAYARYHERTQFDPVGDDPEPPPPTEPSRRDEAMGLRVDLARVLAVIQEVTTPTRRLSLLSRDVPLTVLLSHVEQAKAYRAGGSSMVVRPADEAFDQLVEQRVIPELVFDLPDWKLMLGRIYYGVGPLDSVPHAVAKGGSAKVERQANRALDDLRDAFTDTGVRA